MVARTIIRTTGYVGAPGINVLHWTRGLGPEVTDPEAVGQFHLEVQTMLESYLDIIPSTITISIDPDVPYFQHTDGVILGVTTDEGYPRSYSGTSSLNNGPRDTALCIRYRTEEFVNGRRLQGRTFLGPISSDAIGNDGQIETGWITDTPDFFTALYTGIGARLAVWHRPTNEPPSNGAYGDVTSVTCNATPGTMRSRKT